MPGHSLFKLAQSPKIIGLECLNDGLPGQATTPDSAVNSTLGQWMNEAAGIPAERSPIKDDPQRPVEKRDRSTFDGATSRRINPQLTAEMLDHCHRRA